MIWQREFGPHGDGLQDGGRSVDGISGTVKWIFYIKFFYLFNKIIQNILVELFSLGEHWKNGSPVNPTGQVQIGLWFLVVQSALTPQVFGHGSVHFLFKQAKWNGHSAFTTHSGLQLGGIPLYSGRHVQTAWPFTSRHLLFGPHGDGEHGSNGIPKNE